MTTLNTMFNGSGDYGFAKEAYELINQYRQQSTSEIVLNLTGNTTNTNTNTNNFNLSNISNSNMLSINNALNWVYDSLYGNNFRPSYLTPETNNLFTNQTNIQNSLQNVLGNALSNFYGQYNY